MSLTRAVSWCLPKYLLELSNIQAVTHIISFRGRSLLWTGWIQLWKEKALRKNSPHEENSSLGFIKAFHQLQWKMPHQWHLLAHERNSIFYCKQIQSMISEYQKNIATQWIRHDFVWKFQQSISTDKNGCVVNKSSFWNSLIIQKSSGLVLFMLLILPIICFAL